VRLADLPLMEKAGCDERASATISAEEVERGMVYNLSSVSTC
jgi:hypothetical protein